MRELELDTIKIDRAFVDQMLTKPEEARIVRAIVSLGRSLGLKTTAEGIESEELAKALTELGCSHGQGFYFSPPLEADAALDYWLARNA